MAVDTSVNKGLLTALGALTGLVGLIAMIRLIAGAGFTSVFAWAFLLAAMLPWIGYCVWRARHGNLRPRGALGVVGLAAFGLISVWLFTLGPVVALACSLLGFVIIWVHDWPKLRERQESQYVRIEELTAEEQGEAFEETSELPVEDQSGWPGGSVPEQAPERSQQRPQELTTDTPRTAA